MKEIKWNCINCDYLTANSTTMLCPKCENSMLVIPDKMDNSLFIATVKIVRDFYTLDLILNNQETGVDLFDLDGKKVITIQTWKDFQNFFGNFFYRQFVTEKSD